MNGKDKVRKALADLIMEKPFSQITINELYTRAGIAKASFYYYFNDRFDCVCYLLTDSILKPFTEDCGKKSTPWKKRIMEMYALMMKFEGKLKNVILYDHPHDIYARILSFYKERLTEYLHNRNADIDLLDVRRSIQCLAQSDMMMIYQYLLGYVSEQGLKDITPEIWTMSVPHNLYKYLA